MSLRDRANVVWPADAVEVGLIVDAWGIKGWIKVHPFSADAQALLASRCWYVKSTVLRPAVRSGTIVDAELEFSSQLHVISVKEHGDLIVAQVEAVETRTAAESLRGGRVFIGRASFPTPGPDEFYWIDLLGLAVVNREGVALGTVVGLIDTGPHSVLRVAPNEAAVESDERLIPFVAAYVDDVSLDQARISVDWGLDF